MDVYWKILKEALPVLLFCSIGGLIAGIIVSDMSLYLSVLPGILILAPAVMSITDSVLGTFNSRITSAIHSGKIDINSFNNPILYENISGILTITFCISIVLGIVAHYVSLFFIGTSMGLVKFIFVSLTTHLLSYVSMILICLAIIFVSVKFKKDPDDIVSPSAPILSDMASMFFLLLVVKLVTFL